LLLSYSLVCRTLERQTEQVRTGVEPCHAAKPSRNFVRRPMESSENTEKWFALKVRTRNESTVDTMLKGRNYETLLPTYTENRRYSDRIRKVDMALYPGYIFCRFDPGQRLPILTTPSVEYIVGTGKLPKPVEDSEMEAI